MKATEDAMREFMAALSGCRTADELVRSLPSAIASLGKFDEAALAILPEGRGETFEAHCLSGKTCWSGPMPLVGSAVQAAVEKGAPLSEAGIGKYSNYFDVRKLAESSLESYAIFPLACEGKIFATLNLASSSEYTFTQEKIQQLAPACDYLAKLLYALMRSETARQHSTSAEIAHLLPHIFFSLDSDFRLFSVDGAPDALLGYSAAELAGMRISNIVHSDDYVRLDAVLRQLAGGSTVKDIDFTFIAKDSSHTRLELRGWRSNTRTYCLLLKPESGSSGGDGAGQGPGLAELVSDAVYTMDAFGVVRSWSKGAQKLFGYSEAEILGTEARRLFPNESTRELDEMIRKLKEGKGIVTSKTERIGKGGMQVNAYSSARALINDDGKITGYLEVLRDLGAEVELGEKERELREQAHRNKDLVGDLAQKDKFISDVSHELRTPLTNIHGYASLLKDGEAGALSKQQQEFMEIIYSETNRLSKLISDVLDLSKMESNKFALKLGLFDPRELEGLCSCESMAREKGLYVNWEFAQDVGEVYGDPAKLAQVLINLIANAIKFTSKGGVTVHVKNVSRTYAQFDVVDTGVGISQDEISKLFKRFSQLSAGVDRKGGTGLGLAITKELVRLHGGKVWATSEPGKGSTFSFSMRRSPPARKKKEK
ncbi:MAG: ATP-binding protein [Candidatus Burarchaeum sp.]|nr:ATP-binding protein [Candidatus Burarchaeum sp.]MDO8339983.1 ATP-binding protein [Candidatus Burarchaeum sp.]